MDDGFMGGTKLESVTYVLIQDSAMMAHIRESGGKFVVPIPSAKVLS